MRTFNNGDKMRAKKYIDMAIKINRFFFDGDQKCLLLIKKLQGMTSDVIEVIKNYPSAGDRDVFTLDYLRKEFLKAIPHIQKDEYRSARGYITPACNDLEAFSAKRRQYGNLLSSVLSVAKQLNEEINKLTMAQRNVAKKGIGSFNTMSQRGNFAESGRFSGLDL